VGQARLRPSAWWIRWAAFVAVALFGLALRLPQLDARPMHTDEAVNAYIVGQLLAGQKYTYDAQDRHGPALAALAPAAHSFAARAGGEGHAKPFWYYAHLLAGGRSGALILLWSPAPK